MTATTYELASADGDDYTRLGVEEAESFANEPFEDALLGDKAYSVEDVGRRTFLVGRAAISGLAENFQTDRVMPKRMMGAILSQTYLGPENHLG